MCSSQSNDDPTTYDGPVYSTPRVYDLAGAKREPRGSVALAVIGELLTEWDGRHSPTEGGTHYNRGYVTALRDARDLIVDAESKL